MSETTVKKSIINRCALLKEVKEYGNRTYAELVKKYHVSSGFLKTAKEMGLVSYDKSSKVKWLAGRADPNISMVKNILSKETMYKVASRDKKITIQPTNTSIITSTIPNTTVEYSPTENKEFTVKINGNNVILNIKDFVHLISQQ